MPSSTRTLVIIGGGFSGTVLAANLLKTSPQAATRIVLIERSGRFGRGVAYAPGPRQCLLNVPAGRMSAVSAQPAQLVEFARHRLPDVTADTYLPRELYGEYLQQVLRTAELAAPAHVRLERVYGEATAVHPVRGSGQWVVETGGRDFLADRVVLACGDPPATGRRYAGRVATHPAYVCDPHRDPWVRPEDETVLLIGTGLTMADVAVSVADNPNVRLLAVSRHGLLPATQEPARPPLLGAATDLLAGLETLGPRRVIAAVRALARTVQDQGGDWREVITAVRAEAPRLWQNWSEAERRRFLRHARAYWDIHRHRLPPTVAAAMEQMRAGGRLQVHAGAIDSLSPAAHRIRVHWRPRGCSAVEEILVDRVIDCSGSQHRLAHTRDTLLRQLLDSGLASADPKGLGLITGRHGALIGADGRPAVGLYYLGPMLRAQHWEATAVGELRQRAEELATLLTADPAAARPAGAREYAPGHASQGRRVAGLRHR